MVLLRSNIEPHRGRGWLELPSGFGPLNRDFAEVFVAQVESLRGDCTLAFDGQ